MVDSREMDEMPAAPGPARIDVRAGWLTTAMEKLAGGDKAIGKDPVIIYQ